jgi:hypothetical protein
MADVTTTFAAKDTGFAATLQRIQQRLSHFQKSMKGVTASATKMRATFAPLTRSVVGLGVAYLGVSQAMSAFNKALQIAGTLDDLTKTTGETAGNLLLMQKAFDLAGVGSEKLGIALATQARFITALAEGTPNAVKTAQALGVTMADLAGKTPTEQMKVLLTAIAGVGDANLRTALSMEIFKRSGKDMVPLALNLGQELETAAKKLGSLPDIMSNYGSKLATVDDNMKAIAEKAPAFFAGFIAGTAGIEDATEALANFDAAAMGFDFGSIVGGALAEPGLAFVAMGEGLLLAITTAADFLVNSVKFAADVYAKAMMDPALWMGVSEMLMALIGGLANKISQVLLSAIKVPIKILADLPTIMGGKVFKGITAGIEAVQGYVDEQASQAGEELVTAVDTISTIIGDAARSTERKDPNLFSSDIQSREFAGSLDVLRQTGKVTPQPIQTPKSITAEHIAQVYKEQADKIRKSGLGAVEQTKLMMQLDMKKREAFLNLGKPLGPASDIIQGATMPKRDRDAASKPDPIGAMAEPATETTMAKAVELLDILTQKLPQPALV